MWYRPTDCNESLYTILTVYSFVHCFFNINILWYPTFRYWALKGSSNGTVNKPEVQTSFCISDMEVCTLFSCSLYSIPINLKITYHLLNYKSLLDMLPLQHCFNHPDNVIGFRIPDFVRMCFNCLSLSFPLLIIQTIACLYRIKCGASLINSHKKQNSCSPVHIFTQIYDLFQTNNNISNVLFISWIQEER